MLAVKNGSQVTFSSSWARNHENYQLDFCQPSNAHAWCVYKSQIGESIQVSSEVARFWTGLILQGRGDNEQRVTAIKVAYSMNGKDEVYVDEGRIFPACRDRNTKRYIDFNYPIYARFIKIYPQTWNEYISLRFDAIYIDDTGLITKNGPTTNPPPPVLKPE